MSDVNGMPSFRIWSRNATFVVPTAISLIRPMSHGATFGSPGPGLPEVPEEKKIPVPVPFSRPASAQGSCAVQLAVSADPAGAHGLPPIR